MDTEFKQLGIYLTTKLNQIITSLNTKVTANDTVANAMKLENKTLSEVLADSLSMIRAGVAVDGDNLNKLYGKIQTLQAAVNSINALLSSDDTTLDEMQEIVDFIKTNKSTLDNLSIASISGLQAALDSKVNTSDLGRVTDFTNYMNTHLNAIA